VFAGLAKLPRRDEFERAIQRYDLLPGRFVPFVAAFLPPFELGAGICLALGFGTPAVALLLAGTLLLFAGAVAVALIRGREIDCGCFSVAAPRRITWSRVTTNILLAGMAIAVAFSAPRALSIDSLLFGRAGAVTTAEAAGSLIAATSILGAVVIATEGLRVRRAVLSLRAAEPQVE
jgi:putative oxidoreductase